MDGVGAPRLAAAARTCDKSCCISVLVVLPGCSDILASLVPESSLLRAKNSTVTSTMSPAH